MINEKSCGALVYREKDDEVEILVLKHRLGGHWAFPKGHVEGAETERETALREVKEETGLTIKLHRYYRRRVSYSPRRGVLKEVVYFLGYAEDSKTTMQEEEISEIEWFNIDEVPKHLTHKNDRQLLYTAKRVLIKDGIIKKRKRRLTANKGD